MHHALRFLALSALVLTVAACDSADPIAPEPQATTGTVSGRISLPIGSGGDLSNTRVAMYADDDDWANDQYVLQVAAGSDGSFTFNNVVPGTYYFDAWKDNDNSGGFSNGDYFGVLGSVSAAGANLTPMQVAAGQSTAVNFQISILGGAARTAQLRQLRSAD